MYVALKLRQRVPQNDKMDDDPGQCASYGLLCLCCLLLSVWYGTGRCDLTLLQMWRREALCPCSAHKKKTVVASVLRAPGCSRATYALICMFARGLEYVCAYV